jgi:hypothetical protein
LPRDAAPAEVAAFANGDVVGVAVVRGSKEVLVIEAAAPRALTPESLSYEVSARQPARHVVFDAPDRGIGRTAVDAVALPDSRCRVRLSTSGAVLVAARPAVFLLGPAAGGCKVTEDAEVMATGGADPPLPAVDPQSKLRGGCGCALSTCATGGSPHARRAAAAVSALLVLGALWSARRRGRRPRG